MDYPFLGSAPKMGAGNLRCVNISLSLSPTQDLFSLMNLCPMTDCGPIERHLQCDHQDRYITEMEIMGELYRCFTDKIICKEYN